LFSLHPLLGCYHVQQASKYWEKLEFSEDGKTLVLTGRIVQNCACAFADCPQPPQALCDYCCKGFQQEFFRTLLGQDVEIEITEAYLSGGQRCSTVIHLV
jgi:predicted ArsR family transcriptional regulator